MLVLRNERGQNLVQSLRESGVEAQLCSPLAFLPIEFTAPTEVNWIVLTSATAVGFVSGRWPTHDHVAVVGPATRRAAEAAGLRVDLQPVVASGAGLVAELPAGCGASLWLPRSAIGVPELPPALTGLGYRVIVTPVYDTVIRQADTAGFDAAVVSSPSGIKALGPGPGIPLIAIGETTAKAVVEAGHRLLGIAEQASPGRILALLGLH